MKKIFIGIGIIAIIIMSIVLFRNSQYTSKSSGKINSSADSSSQSITSATIKEYSDPVGFKFSYPGSVSVSPKNTTDANVYSSLEITSSSIPGKITIDAVSSNLLTLDEILKSKSSVTDIKLADLDAQQYAEKGNVITLALDQGVLFTITTSSGGNVTFWKEVNNKLISSFTFELPETTQVQSDTTTPSNNSTDSDVSFEGEEIIE